jgi:hypothetical protein
MTETTNWIIDRAFVEKSGIGGHIDDLEYWNGHLVEMQTELSEKAPTWDHIHAAETR